jgi:hypothetical protein
VAVKPIVNLLASEISHMPLLFVWRDSGVTEKHGFKLDLKVANFELPGQGFIPMTDRAPGLLSGKYDFLSGLHHEPYEYRARGDKRFAYLAQAQNDWDDRIICTEDIKTPKDLEGKKVIMTAMAPCVYGNLRHSLEVGGADLSKIEFQPLRPREDGPRRFGGAGSPTAVEMVAKGEAVAANVDAPFDKRAERLGLHKLEMPSIPVIHNATVCSNIEWVRENEETTMAFLRSMVDAIHFFKMEPEKTREIIERNHAPLFNLNAEEIEHLQKVWAELLSAKPYPHPLAVWNVYNLDVAHNPEVNFIGPMDLWNTTYLRAIDDSDYIDELYGSAKAAQNPKVTAAI